MPRSRLRLPLPAPAEQTHCAEAGGKERKGGWERRGCGSDGIVKTKSLACTEVVASSLKLSARLIGEQCGLARYRVNSTEAVSRALPLSRYRAASFRRSPLDARSDSPQTGQAGL